MIDSGKRPYELRRREIAPVAQHILLTDALKTSKNRYDGINQIVNNMKLRRLCIPPNGSGSPLSTSDCKRGMLLGLPRPKTGGGRRMHQSVALPDNSDRSTCRAPQYPA